MKAGSRLAPGIVASNALVVVLVGLFVWLSCYQIRSPGPYYDEWIHVPVSLRTLGECGIEAAVSHSVGCLPTMQQPPYVGPVKAWLAAPVFQLFGVNPWSVRLPPILLIAGVLLLFHRFIARRMGPGPALALVALLATDPVLASVARLDFGPFAIAYACKLLGFAALWRWLETGGAGPLLAAALLCLVGFVDKLNFSWVIASFALACAVLPNGMLWQRLRQARWTEYLVLLAWVVALGWIVAKLVLPAMALPLPRNEGGLWAHARHVLNLYNGTFSGLAMLQWMFPVSAPARSWPILLLLAQNLLAWFVLWRWRGDAGEPRGERQLLAFSTAVVPLMLLMMVMTRQTGGVHHLVLLLPFQWLQLVCLATVVLREGSIRAWPRRALAALAAVTVAAVLFNNLMVNAMYLRAWNGDYGYRPYFDPALYEMAAFVDRLPVDGAVSVQWGTHQALLSLSSQARRPQIRDWWAIFSDPPQADDKRTRWLFDTWLDGRQMAFVGFHPATGLPGAPHLSAYLDAWPHCRLGRWQVRDARGQPVLEVAHYGFGRAGCASSTHGIPR